MSKNFEEKSVAFKRALHALTYALSLSEDIADSNEREEFSELLESVSFDNDLSSLLDNLDREYPDYNDYSQIQRGHLTGVWYQQMKKDSGEIFLRDIIGNELNAPRPIATFMDMKDMADEYTARQISCFFVPFNTPPAFESVDLDETNHHPVALADIHSDGSANQLAIKTIQTADDLNEGVSVG